jgi:hypothetical protein
MASEMYDMLPPSGKDDRERITYEGMNPMAPIGRIVRHRGFIRAKAESTIALMHGDL